MFTSELHSCSAETLSDPFKHDLVVMIYIWLEWESAGLLYQLK